MLPIRRAWGDSDATLRGLSLEPDRKALVHRVRVAADAVEREAMARAHQVGEVWQPSPRVDAVIQNPRVGLKGSEPGIFIRLRIIHVPANADDTLRILPSKLSLEGRARAVRVVQRAIWSGHTTSDTEVHPSREPGGLRGRSDGVDANRSEERRVGKECRCR